ncbi:MAG: hypothetical protein ABJE66_04525 [Deltaproteobacteria bacterium]
MARSPQFQLSKDMNLGPHTALVEEILATIERGEILSPRASSFEPDALVVHDLPEAKRYAWSRPIAGAESSTWTDLREDEVAPFHAAPYDHPELKPAYDATDGLLPNLLGLLRGKLPSSYSELLDDIAADLQHCAMNRGLYGLVPNSFWERIWRVYAAGAWPCGWAGEYPEGRIVIYQPPPNPAA